MIDIVERLRQSSLQMAARWPGPIMSEAADEIERLREKLSYHVEAIGRLEFENARLHDELRDAIAT